MHQQSEDWKRHTLAETNFERLPVRSPSGEVVALADLSDAAFQHWIHTGDTEVLARLHENWLKAGNAEKGRRLVEAGVYPFTNFGEIPMGREVDWTIGQPGQDNLSWQLHSLVFLRDVLALWCTDQEKSRYELVRLIVKDWAKNNIVQNPLSKFSWNDHTTALRLTTLANVFLFFRNNVPADTGFLRELITLAARHQQVLLADKFYVRGTNHGLDQAFSLFQSSYYFSFLDGIESIRGVARERLKYEVTKSFAEDAVHIENSPEYHAVILSSSLQINSIVSSLEGQALIPALDEFVEKALVFMAYMIRPDGCFPPIGDTCTAPPRNKLEWLKAFKGYPEFEYALTQGNAGSDPSANHKILPTSGYAIFRGDSSLFSREDRLHLVYKCGFLSHYHRQDDDNHITLFAYGEEWLADGGLYIHDHQNATREYMRSALSHNVFVPIGVKAERRNRPKHPPAITEFDESDGDGMVRGSSNVHAGFVCSREVRYSGATTIQVLDHAASIDGSAGQYQQLWQIPDGHVVSVHASGFFVRSPKSGVVMVVTIQGDALDDVGIVAEDPSILSVRSQSYGELEPVTVVRARASGIEVSLEVRIEFLKPGLTKLVS